LEPLSTSAFYVTENDFTAAKLTFLGKIPLLAFELTSLLRLDASILTLSINRHSFSQQIEK